MNVTVPEAGRDNHAPAIHRGAGARKARRLDSRPGAHRDNPSVVDDNGDVLNEWIIGRRIDPGSGQYKV